MNIIIYKYEIDLYTRAPARFVRSKMNMFKKKKSHHTFINVSPEPPSKTLLPGGLHSVPDRADPVRSALVTRSSGT